MHTEFSGGICLENIQLGVQEGGVKKYGCRPDKREAMTVKVEGTDSGWCALAIFGMSSVVEPLVCASRYLSTVAM
jgi:hypothetical protein